MAEEPSVFSVYFDERLVARITADSVGEDSAHGDIEFLPDFDALARPEFAEVAGWERRMGETACLESKEDDAPSPFSAALDRYCQAWEALTPRIRVAGLPGELTEIQFPLDPECWPRGTNWASLYWKAPEEKLDTETRLPSHLVGWAEVTRVAERGAGLTAALRCPCGCSRLELHCTGESHLAGQPGSPPPSAVMVGEGAEAHWYFAIQAVCPQCGSERVVFDADLHGWYLVTGRPEVTARLAALPRPPLVPWRCARCGGLAHEGSASFTFDSPLDFRERVKGKVPGERRCEAFSWVAMGVRCCGCGLGTDCWVDYETR